MTWKTHLLGGVQAGLILATLTNADPKTAAIEIGASMVGSILPDIDQPNSKISKSDLLLKKVSKGLSEVTKHRREVHTVWASFLFGLLALVLLKLVSYSAATGGSFWLGAAVAFLLDMMGWKIGSLVGIVIFIFAPSALNLNILPLDDKAIPMYALAVFAGCIAHLIYDTANVQGIMWLHPFKKTRYHFMNIQTESKKEDLFMFAMVFLTMFLMVVFNPFKTQNLVSIFDAIR